MGKKDEYQLLFPDMEDKGIIESEELIIFESDDDSDDQGTS